MRTPLSRWRTLRQARASTAHLKGMILGSCTFQMGTEPCCCGRDDCDTPNDQGMPKLCWKTIPTWQTVLFGRCFYHIFKRSWK